MDAGQRQPTANRQSNTASLEQKQRLKDKKKRKKKTAVNASAVTKYNVAYLRKNPSIFTLKQLSFHKQNQSKIKPKNQPKFGIKKTTQNFTKK
ncbi:MAG: hypothetical protein J6V37_01650 [Clostridia bacterium]|nr:hypothetical protein [Clostridia bacterium]